MTKGSMRRMASIGATVALATAGSVLAFGASAGAASVEKSYEEEGEHHYVVPEGVCWVTIEAFGAEGGGALDVDDDAFVPGGLGGQAEARIAVTPGETLEVNVGGAGEDAVDNAAGEGGDNGGGDGGLADPTGHNAGGGGGGASDVRQGGGGLDARVLVAGGGGGAGGGTAPPEPPASGGHGGGEEGEDGQNSVEDLVTEGGEGGNQDEGGDGGVAALAALNGDDGEFGEGGEGGGAAEIDVDGGGGGGGGWYGGGGGGGGIDADDQTAGAGGGGGSGYGPEWVEFDSGEQEDDGEVTISYDPALDSCAAEAIVIEPKFTG